MIDPIVVDGRKIRYWRMMRAMSQVELEKKAVMGKGTLCQIEMEHRRPYASTIGKIARALDVDPRELLKAPRQEAHREEGVMLAS